jgi:hypothetical protein
MTMKDVRDIKGLLARGKDLRCGGVRFQNPSGSGVSSIVDSSGAVG